MTRVRFRILAAGLGVVALPACVALDGNLAIGTPPTTTAVAASPTAGPVGASNTVRRVEPAQPPIQYIAVPADQLVRNAAGQMMVKASAIPPGYMPVAAPPSAGPMPVAMAGVPAPAPTPVPPPAPTPALTATPIAAAPQTPSPVTEPIEMVAVSHTAEPPLAQAEAPRKLPEVVKQTPVAIPAPSQTPAGMPAYVPPGAQVLVLQPENGLQPAQYKPAPITEPIPNLLTPPTPPEELKLVSATRGNCTPTPLQAALQAYQAKSPAEAEKQLSHLDPINRDLLKKVLPLAAKLGDQSVPAANPTEVAEMVDQLQQVVGSLRTKAGLQIAKLCYCRLPAKPVRQGVYQPLPDDQVYRVGESVELYMELRNFSCEARDREYATHLSTVIEVRDDRNEVVLRHEFERDRPEIGQTPKQEHFHICRFPVQGLPAGKYSLHATVTDIPTGKAATRVLPLHVEAAARRVARGTAE
jgi:hypothetical protein